MTVLEMESNVMILDRDEMIRDMNQSARRSNYTMTGGGTSTVFWDWDEYILGRQEDDTFSDRQATIRRHTVVANMSELLNEMARRHLVSRLAFIDKRGVGPVGVLTMTDLLVERVGIEACIVRPGKRLLVASIKGRPVQPGERFMVVSDVATSGNTILEVARRLRELGGVPCCACVIWDRGDISERLASEGIELASLAGPGSLDD